MDFLWFWVSVAFAVEMSRRSVKHCYPKPTPSAVVQQLKEPLLHADGTCPYNCCYLDTDEYFTTDSESGTETETETDETVTSMTSDTLSSEDLEYYTESLVGNNTVKVLVTDETMQGIIGHLYPAAVPGRPKQVQIKVSAKAVATMYRKEGSVKVHPQPSGALDQAAHSFGSQLTKEKLPVISEDGPQQFPFLPPIPEVMSSKGQCSHKV